MTFGICANNMVVRDSGGEWKDVLSLFDARARHLEAAQQFKTDASYLEKTSDEFSKLDASHDEWTNSLAKRATAVAQRLQASDYDSSLAQVDALLARLSRS